MAYGQKTKDLLNDHEKNIVAMFKHHVERNGGIPVMLSRRSADHQWLQWRDWRIANRLGVKFIDHVKKNGDNFQVPCAVSPIVV